MVKNWNLAEIGSKQVETMFRVRKWLFKPNLDFKPQSLNPFNTLRPCKIRLFERTNGGMSIGDSRHHEITLWQQGLECGSAGETWGFQWHWVWFVSLPPGGHYTWWKVTFTLEISKNYSKSVTLIVTCDRDFPDWDLIWCHSEGKCGPVLCWPWDDSKVWIPLDLRDWRFENVNISMWTRGRCPLRPPLIPI